MDMYQFQFHYDLILFNEKEELEYVFFRFQFHYDLILLSVTLTSIRPPTIFQFHYDLILLWIDELESDIYIKISISL